MNQSRSTDETLPSGSVILWSKGIQEDPSRNVKAFVQCSLCGQSRLATIQRSKKEFTGHCVPCACREKNSGSGHPSWKGGRLHSEGYIYLHRSLISPAETEQFTSMFIKTGYILEHRLIIARSLGRALEKSEVVHHLHGIKDDNRLANLQVLDPVSHGREGSVRLRYLEGEILRLQILLEQSGTPY